MDKLPFVSVVVPVYNSAGFIEKLLDNLLAQDYPKHLHEIIIVDNHSRDNTKDIIGKYPFILAEENEIQSSYAARNKGLEIAKGEVVAFTDADCQPLVEWLSEGVRTLLDSNADVVAGNVKFIYSEKPTAAEIYDSITHMQMESEVKEKGVAPTANLFIKREMFEKIGVFDSRVKSGGDVQWTRKATTSGYQLVYSEKAAVKHPTRNLAQFTKKVMRTGAGRIHARLAAGHSVIHEFFYTPYAIFFKIHLNKDMLKRRFEERGLSQREVRFWKVCSVGLFTNFISHVATLVEFFRIFPLILCKKYKVRKHEK
ncbi:MAG: glycosyltransferase [Sedimentisphaeraceae bacterium JB056]